MEFGHSLGIYKMDFFPLKKKSQVLPSSQLSNTAQQYKAGCCWLGHSLEHTVRSEDETRAEQPATARTSDQLAWCPGGRCWFRFGSNHSGAAPATPITTPGGGAVARYSTDFVLFL